ncbi:hypothetical protein GMMP15_1160001 [Candidatus Magnetomoraceae bacterium gMMP-15]
MIIQFIQRITFILIFFYAFIFCLPSQAAENRVALVIGNNDYISKPLDKAVNDANDMAEILTFCNFEVMKYINADRKTMRQAIREFGEKINKGAIGLFYYAGHGVQVKGENYFVPVGTDVHSEAEVEDECLKVSSVLRKMNEAGNPLNIILLDACQNNPFELKFSLSEQGFVKMDAPINSVIQYATKPGSLAVETRGRNGLYTSALLKYLPVKGLELKDFFMKVRKDVIKASNGKQIPCEFQLLTDDFYFVSEKYTTTSSVEVAGLSRKLSINQNGNDEGLLENLLKHVRRNFVLYIVILGICIICILVFQLSKLRKRMNYLEIKKKYTPTPKKVLAEGSEINKYKQKVDLLEKDLKKSQTTLKKVLAKGSEINKYKQKVDLLEKDLKKSQTTLKKALEVKPKKSETTAKKVLKKKPKQFVFKLPDTGQIKCYNNEKEISCPQPGENFYGQDANYIRNPMSFTKLDKNGNDLPDSAKSWTMVRDNNTGLIWDVTTKDEYNWHDASNKFITKLNAQKFGGYSDWRMPTREELRSIVNYGKVFSAIDERYFSKMSEFYWSSSSFAYRNDGAWGVYFYRGDDYGHYKSSSYYVRAVRFGQESVIRLFDNLIINGDGTIKDKNTGLMWQQVTAPKKMTWKQSLEYCENLNLAGYNDWRLPNIKELASIVDLRKYKPAIDGKYFLETMSEFYWSSSSYASNNGYAWGVYFYYGLDYYGSKSSSYYVRAVRFGQ